MNMKLLVVKILAILILSCCVSVSAAAAQAAPVEPADVIGLWYLNSIKMEGISLYPSEAGVELTLYLNSDNTALLHEMDVDMPGTWTITDGQILVAVEDRSDIMFSLAGGNLYAEEDGVTLIFRKEKTKTDPEPEIDANLLDAGRVNHVSVGQIAYISLSENLTTPFFWQYELSDDSVMTLDHDQYIMDDNPYNADGVGGTHWYYFKAISPGECVIRMLDGDGADDPSRVITYSIVVEETSTDTGIDTVPHSTRKVRQGQVFTVSLGENQSIPFRWKPEISDGSLIELIRDEIDSSGVTSNMPGADGAKRIFYFEALCAGECAIVMNYMYMGDDDQIAQTESYTIIIEQ